MLMVFSIDKLLHQSDLPRLTFIAYSLYRRLEHRNVTATLQNRNLAGVTRQMTKHLDVAKSTRSSAKKHDLYQSIFGSRKDKLCHFPNVGKAGEVHKVVRARTRDA